MSTVTFEAALVQPAVFPCEDDIELSADDLRWWAQQSATTLDEWLAAGWGGSDLDWLTEEADRIAARPDPGGFDTTGLVGACLRKAAQSLAFHKLDTAREYARSQRVDLDAVSAPGVGVRRSPLAAELDVEAAYYLHLDSDAGRLAAHEVLRLAGYAEEFGSRDAKEWVRDEAAWREAAIEAMMEA
jgi:hypothetical protein